MQRLIAALTVCTTLAACAAPTSTHVDSRVVTAMPRHWPAAVVAAPDAPPRVLAVWLSSAQIVPGTDWLGRIATTTNVASLEIRTESFSFNATRVAFGQFVFRQHVLDIVPQYKRRYDLSIIARNTAGTKDVRVVPIDLR
jgi:hypothetical protein